MSRKYFITHKVTALACWGSYLFNGDASGLEDEDVIAADAMVEGIGMGAPVGISDESHGFDPYPHYGPAGDCAEYTFMREQTDADRVRALEDIKEILASPSNSAADCFDLVSCVLADIGMPVPDYADTSEDSQT